MQLVIGGALLAGAVILAPLAWRAARRWYRRHEPTWPWPSTVESGQPVTTAGVAVAGPAGVLESQLARTGCVWHGHEVVRHYWTLPGNEGGTQERACDSIADYASMEVFAIVEPGRSPTSRSVLVDPAGAELSGADMCLQRVVSRPQPGVPAPADDLLARVKGRIFGVFRGETIEFEYREWALREHTPVVAHGTVEMRDGDPVIVAPPDDRLRIERAGSTGPAARAPWPMSDATAALLLAGGVVVSAGIGLILVISGAW